MKQTFDIVEHGLYAVRLLRPSNKPITLTVNGYCINFLLKKGMKITNAFENGGQSICFNSSIREQLIKELTRITKLKVKPKYGKDLIKVIDATRFVKYKFNSTVYGQISFITSPLSMDNPLLSFIPVTGSIADTKLIPYDSVIETSLADAIKYSFNIVYGNGLYISPEKPLIVKKKLINGFIDVSEAKFHDVNIAEELTHFKEVVIEYVKQGIEFQVTKRES